MISVILPVRNEEGLISSSLGRIRNGTTPVPVEIIVVDGQSSDNTMEIAGQYADYVIPSPKANRSFQMHMGAQKSKGDILLFVHVDTELPKNWLEIVSETFKTGRNVPVAAAFSLKFNSERWIFKLISSLANVRTKMTGIPHGDQALVVPRETYFSTGGFPDVPLMEEYLFIPKLKRLGKIKIFPEPIVTSCRKYEENGAIRNAVRNIMIVLLFYLGVPPRRLASWYHT